ncbi:putative membrane protein [Propionispora sp. 2/2-37]|uniref:hypothetical protein n=1 Tax=Propionispora sp. 2/2-37 TaxID=1677858 RepID=UPI0006BB5D14|nr:hypothetical protein [Propionispora sp. 2/2-37]CUH94155.1 putative membrane protein [Propionispora sp. 2/2-37]
MDILLLIVFTIALYVLPELFRRKRPTEYKYPDIPEPEPQPDTKPEKTAEEPIIKDELIKNWVVAPKIKEQSILMSDMKKTESLPVVQTEKLAYPILVNAMIYSEILQKPRAYRPIMYKKR